MFEQLCLVSLMVKLKYILLFLHALSICSNHVVCGDMSGVCCRSVCTRPASSTYFDIYKDVTCLKHHRLYNVWSIKELDK